MELLKGKRILLCVTGGIAAYKSAEFVRMLTTQGAEVRVAMTENATHFVAPLTFEALSGRPVLLHLFEEGTDQRFGHIEAARWADAIVVAPATGNMIGKLAGGIADDIVSTLLMATRSPVVLAPAMNWAMWQNEIVQANVARLASLGRFSIVKPDSGELACGESGQGRLAPLEWILDAACYACRPEKDLAGELVLVSSGPTYEDIDPVRFVANRSSGKMGYAVAREARSRGARVCLVSGPTALNAPYDVELIQVRSAAKMAEAVLSHAGEANVIVKAAAVADYRPSRRSDLKIHKEQGEFQLSLTRTVDILRELGAQKRRDQFLVGFAAETHQVLQNGKDKLREKNLDLIVVNDVSQEGAGFEVETNVVKIIDRQGHIEALPLLSKSKVASILFDQIQKLRANSKKDSGRRASQSSVSNSNVSNSGSGVSSGGGNTPQGQGGNRKSGSSRRRRKPGQGREHQAAMTQGPASHSGAPTPPATQAVPNQGTSTPALAPSPAPSQTPHPVAKTENAATSLRPASENGTGFLAHPERSARPFPAGPEREPSDHDA